MNRKIVDKLKELGLVDGDIANIKVKSPWYIKSLLSFSGWIGALFLLLFIGLFFSMIFFNILKNDMEILFFPIGVGIIFLSSVMLKTAESYFLENLFLAISVAGQALVILSLFNLFGRGLNKEIFLFMALLQALLLWYIPNYTHRVLSSMFLASSLETFSFSIGISPLFLGAFTALVVWLYLNFYYFKDIKLVQPISHGFLLSLLWFSLIPISYYEIVGMPNSNGLNNIYTILMIGVLGYVLWEILKQKDKLEDRDMLLFSFIAFTLLAIFSFYVSGLLLGIIFLLIGFATTYHLLMGVGFILSLYSLSSYYYYLGDNLMDKAEVLAFTGLALLVIRYLLKKLINKEAQNV